VQGETLKEGTEGKGKQGTGKKEQGQTVEEEEDKKDKEDEKEDKKDENLQKTTQQILEVGSVICNSGTEVAFRKSILIRADQFCGSDRFFFRFASTDSDPNTNI
jgi:hypothetical protein